jgi:hypothetical protein
VLKTFLRLPTQFSLVPILPSADAYPFCRNSERSDNLVLRIVTTDKRVMRSFCDRRNLVIRPSRRSSWSRTSLAQMLAVLLLAFALGSPPAATAQSTGIQNSTSLSFRNTFPLAQGSQALASYQGTGVNMLYSATLNYGEDLVLTTASSIKYAQSGSSGTLTISESNDIALLQLTGSATITFSILGVTTGSVNYPISIEYGVPVTAGTYQDVVLGTYSVANAPVGPVNVQVNMQPTIVWTPIINGVYSVQGLGSISPTSLSLAGNPATATISFSATAPLDLYLNSPRLSLQSLSLLLYFPVLIGGLQVADPSVTIVNAGTYYVTAPTSNLISFDPNYYTLYSQLRSSLTSLSSTVQADYAALGSSIQSLQSSFNSLSNQLLSTNPSLTTPKSMVASISSAQQSLQQSLSGIPTQVSSLASQYSNLTSEYTTLKSAVTSAQGLLSQLQQSVSNLASQLGVPTGSASSTSTRSSPRLQSTSTVASQSYTSTGFVSLSTLLLGGVSVASLVIATYALLLLRRRT